MSELKEIVSDKELDNAWANANFGDTSKRDVLRFGLLKCVSGYYQGSTSTCILEDLELITRKYNITKKGKEYLYRAFKEASTL